MKNKIYFLVGLLFGAVLFSGSIALANSEISALFSLQTFFLNGEKTNVFAYNIEGNNYIKLRDAAQLFDANVEYDKSTNSVYIEKAGYVKTEISSVDINDETEIEKVQYADGNAYSKSDFSHKANGNIFDDIYTRDAFNTIRQTIMDTPLIVQGNNNEGYNENYSYAHYVDKEFSFTTQSESDAAMKSVIARLSCYYIYSFSAEPYLQNIFEYPGYRILTVKINGKYEKANQATDEFIEELNNLSDREKIRRIANCISDRIVYKNEDVAGINDVFTSETPVHGICGTYAMSFMYLCQRADIPCVVVKDSDHAWNEVYVDGKWQVTDISYYDIARTDESLFPQSFPKSDPNKQKTEFAKELLVPGSTTKE